MRYFTDEEKNLFDKLHNDKTLDEEKKIIERLKEIENEETKDFPFCH